MNAGWSFWTLPAKSPSGASRTCLGRVARLSRLRKTECSPMRSRSLGICQADLGMSVNDTVQTLHVALALARSEADAQRNRGSNHSEVVGHGKRF